MSHLGTFSKPLRFLGVSAAWWQLLTRLKVSGGVGPDMLVLLTHLASPHPVATESEVFTTSEMQTCSQPTSKLTHSPLLPANPLCQSFVQVQIFNCKGSTDLMLHWSSSVARTRVISFQVHQGMFPRKPKILMNGCVIVCFYSTDCDDTLLVVLPW